MEIKVSRGFPNTTVRNTEVPEEPLDFESFMAIADEENLSAFHFFKPTDHSPYWWGDCSGSTEQAGLKFFWRVQVSSQPSLGHLLAAWVLGMDAAKEEGLAAERRYRTTLAKSKGQTQTNRASPPKHSTLSVEDLLNL